MKKPPLAAGEGVTVYRAEGRGVYVIKVRVFSQQPRYARDGQFLGDFKGLKLR